MDVKASGALPLVGERNRNKKQNLGAQDRRLRLAGREGRRAKGGHGMSQKMGLRNFKGSERCKGHSEPLELMALVN